MLSNKEIDSLTIETNGFNATVHGEEVKAAFQKILHCIEVDADVLSDGETVDMIYSFLCEISVETKNTSPRG